MKKRALSMLLCVVMVMSFIQVPAYASEGSDGSITISSEKTTLKVGETTDVTFQVNAKSDAVGAVNFTVIFPSGLEYVSHEVLVASSDYMMSSYTPVDGKFGCAVTDSGKTGTFNVLKLTVKAKDSNLGNNSLSATIGDMYKVDGSTTMNFGSMDPVNIYTYADLSDDLPVTITAPVKGKVPQSDIAATAQYTGSITWDPAIAAGGKFAANTEYTANVTLTAKDGYQFAEGVTPTVDGSTGVTGVEVKDSGKTLTFNAKFPKTDTRTLEHIDIITNPALELAVPTAAPNATATSERSLAITGIYDDGSGGPVEGTTWKITNDPIPKGVSLDGCTLKVTNEAETCTVHVLATAAGFTDREDVTITKEAPKETAIVATAPAEGTDITIPNGGTENSGNCSYKVYDQYGAEMTGISATWKMKLDPTTVTGVNLIAANGSISVTSDATACKATLYAEGSGVKSNEITFNIARAASVATSLEINVTPDSVNVPTVTEPDATNCAYATYTATVKDQYGEVMNGQTIEWSFTEKPGVTFNNGQLTVTNKADADTVTITAKCGTLTATKTVNINKDAAKATLVEICNQAGEAPETRLLIPAATFTNSEAYTAKVYDQYGVYMPGEMVDWELVSATVNGVELDTTTSTGNAILKVDSTAISGTTFKLKATTATPGTTGVKELDITVQKKNDVSSNINFDNGSLTYNGAGQKYEKAALDSSVTAGDGGTWTYTYAANGGTASLDGGLPKTVGTYTVAATYEDSSNIGSKTATLTIKPKTVDIPAPDTTEYTYDGNAKTYGIADTADYTVTGNTKTNANEAGHIVTVTLKDITNTTWSDGTTGVKIYHFYIYKATPTGEPAYTKITTSGKTLADANLTKDTIAPAGTIKWVAEDGTDLDNDTAVEANKLYKWVFTPSDTANYKPLTGTIKLWSKSTSSGGYYYAPTAAVVPDMPMLYRGCTGDAVKTLQDKLNALGYNSGNVDGIFGAKTYAAVTAFQKANSLGVDGIVGKLTWGKLYGVSPAMPVETTTVVGRPMVSYGSRGDAVRKLQELLNALGYDCGSVDGIFGSKTKAAVLAFQKANGLGADGIVGPLTWAKLG